MFPQQPAYLFHRQHIASAITSHHLRQIPPASSPSPNRHERRRDHAAASVRRHDAADATVGSLYGRLTVRR
jgi:hypothetical protein